MALTDEDYMLYQACPNAFLRAALKELDMPSKEKSAAILTIKGAAKMSPEGRRAIAQWIKKQADALVKDGLLYSGKFTARYLYR